MKQDNVSPTQAVIKCTDLHRIFELGPERLEILNGLNLEVQKGEMLSIMGASGAGKSTLLNLLGILDKPDSGSIEIAGNNVAGMKETQAADIRNRHIGFVFQFHHLLPEFTATENLAMPLLLRGESKASAFDHSRKILERVGLTARGEHKPSELSGGERQRVAIARALIGKPDVLLMDEPTGNLDSQNAGKIMALIEELNAEYQIALILVTHDPSVASSMQRQLELKNGVLVEQSA